MISWWLAEACWQAGCNGPCVRKGSWHFDREEEGPTEAKWTATWGGEGRVRRDVQASGLNCLGRRSIHPSWEVSWSGDHSFCWDPADLSFMVLKFFHCQNLYFSKAVNFSDQFLSGVTEGGNGLYSSKSSLGESYCSSTLQLTRNTLIWQGW